MKLESFCKAKDILNKTNWLIIDWEKRYSQESKGGSINKMPYSGERELVEPTSSRKTGHQMRDVVAILKSKL